MNELYDIVCVENGRVTSITVWKKVELERACRLLKRYDSEYGLMLSGTTWLNRPVDGETKRIEFDGLEPFTQNGVKKYKKIKKVENIVMFTPKTK